jgi:hypothetical protein
MKISEQDIKVLINFLIRNEYFKKQMFPFFSLIFFIGLLILLSLYYYFKET